MNKKLVLTALLLLATACGSERVLAPTQMSADALPTSPPPAPTNLTIQITQVTKRDVLSYIAKWTDQSGGLAHSQLEIYTDIFDGVYDWYWNGAAVDPGVTTNLSVVAVSRSMIAANKICFRLKQYWGDLSTVWLWSLPSNIVCLPPKKSH